MVTGLPPDLFQQIENSWFGKSSSIAENLSHSVSATLVTTQELLIDDDQKLGHESAEDLLRGSSTQGSSSDNSKSSEQIQGVEIRTATKLVGEGGWYLDSQLLSLKYMPSGHADPVVAAWVQFAGLMDASARPNVNGAAGTGNDMQPWHSPNWKPGSEAVGGCTECHLLPSYTTHDLSRSDWRAEAGSSAKTFTKFSHKPHMTLAVTADCKHCHAFNKTAPSPAAELTRSVGDQSTRLVQLQALQQRFRCEFKQME
jgi:hypothetical protein